MSDVIHHRNQSPAATPTPKTTTTPAAAAEAATVAGGGLLGDIAEEDHTSEPVSSHALDREWSLWQRVAARQGSNSSSSSSSCRPDLNATVNSTLVQPRGEPHRAVSSREKVSTEAERNGPMSHGRSSLTTTPDAATAVSPGFQGSHTAQTMSWEVLDARKANVSHILTCKCTQKKASFNGYSTAGMGIQMLRRSKSIPRHRSSDCVNSSAVQYGCLDEAEDEDELACSLSAHAATPRQRTGSMPEHTFGRRERGLIQDDLIIGLNPGITKILNQSRRVGQVRPDIYDPPSPEPKNATGNNTTHCTCLCCIADTCLCVSERLFSHNVDTRVRSKQEEANPTRFKQVAARGSSHVPRGLSPLALTPNWSVSTSSSTETPFRPISPIHLAVSTGRGSLSPTYNGSARGSRTPSPTLSARSLSPSPKPRKRSNTFSGLGQGVVFSPPRSPLRIPRDRIQPSRGSISDLSDKHSHEDGGEEADLFSCRPVFRQRSRTCPENKAWRRRRKCSNRPPTPPPQAIGSPWANFGGESYQPQASTVGLSDKPRRPSDLTQLPEDQPHDTVPDDSTGRKQAYTPPARVTRNNVAALGMVNNNNCVGTISGNADGTPEDLPKPRAIPAVLPSIRREKVSEV